MRLETIRIQNFRSFKDETISFDDYTCLVGTNGAGKSNVLTALNVFFRNTSSAPTNVVSLSEEDFHHRNKDDPVRITLTFGAIPSEAAEDLSLYIRHGKLIVSAIAHWNATARSAEVKQYGVRLVMKDFAEYFAAVDAKAKAPELQTI